MIKKRLIQLLAESKKYIFYQVLWQWLALLCQTAAVFTIADLLERLLTGNLTQQQVLAHGAVLLCCAVLRFVFDRMNVKASYAASINVKKILREKIYEKLLRLGASYREQVSTAEIVQMSGEGVEQLETYFGKYLSQLFYSLLAPVTLFVILSRTSLKAGLVLLICVPLIPVSIVAVQKIAKRLLNKYWSVYTELGDSFLENLQGLTTLKIYQADERRAEEMDEESQHFRRITMKVLTMQLNSTSVMDIIAYGGAAAGMITVLQQFFAGNVGLSGTITVILLASEFFIPLRLLGSFFHIAMNGMAASDRMFEFLDLPEPEEKTEQLSGGTLSLSMDGVRFSYTAEREILGGVSMEFPAGEFVSIVGESGCGKSTVIGLLMGRNRGYQGSVRIRGEKDLELSAVSERSLMEHMTMVSHESYLFRGTVEENLRMGNPGASEQQLRDALEQVNLLGFLDGQDGLQTMVTERGSNFSGGQRQRLALARALLHDTPVYLFDEATSNIDMESEEMIMQVIRRLAETRTVILISHRLANVTESDRIYYLKNGRVAESGTHSRLMELQGEYCALYTRQSELEQYSEVKTA